MNTLIQVFDSSKLKGDYKELRTALQDKGFFQKNPVRSITEFTTHIALLLFGLILFIISTNIWVEVASLFIITYGSLGIATNAHSSSHHATSNSLLINNALTYFGYSFIIGFSACSWWERHCVIHHPHPNIIGMDDDIDLMPFLALNKDEVRNSRGFYRVFYRYQWMFMPVFLAFNLFNMQISGWRYLLSQLRNGKTRRPAHWLDLLLLIMHYISWIGVPLFFFSASDVLLFYVLRSALGGYGMFIVFAPAHFPAEAVFLHWQLKSESFLFRQTATTLNYRTRFLGHFVCAGTDYQIEHHLFPRIPHHHYPKVSVLLKKFCESKGYPYRTLGWGEAIWKSFMTFYHPKWVFDNSSPALSSIDKT